MVFFQETLGASAPNSESPQTNQTCYLHPQRLPDNITWWGKIWCKKFNLAMWSKSAFGILVRFSYQYCLPPIAKNTPTPQQRDANYLPGLLIDAKTNVIWSPWFEWACNFRHGITHHPLHFLVALPTPWLSKGNKSSLAIPSSPTIAASARQEHLNSKRSHPNNQHNLASQIHKT